MKDWRKKRKIKLAELTLSAHLLAYMIAIVVIVANRSMEDYSFSTSTMLLLGIILPVAFLVLLDLHFIQKTYSARVIMFWNIAKHVVLFTVITTLYFGFQDEQSWIFATIYMLPVALSCITLGRWWGSIFAVASVVSVFFHSREVGYSGGQALGIMEAAMVFGSVFLFLAWFLSNIVELEKEAAEGLRQERDLISKIMDTSPAGIIVLDSGEKVQYINARVADILSIKRKGIRNNQIHEMNFSQGNDYGFLKEFFQKVVKLKRPIYNDTITANIAGKALYLSVSGAPIFDADRCIYQVVLVIDDITKQTKMNEEIMRADKLESLGLLAGGIAHDFNNYMAVIMGNISLVRVRSKDKTIAGNLENMEKAALQARELTRKLFVFVKGGAPIKKIVPLQELLLDTAGFALTGSMATIELNLAHDLLPIEADESQIVQVINNILINAAQSMPNGGKVELKARNINAGDDEQSQTLPLKEGKYVQITITDEGEGIPGNIIKKIFDPFFSTKPQGSGLGLATAHTIVQSHGGSLQVESKQGDGTSFHLYLPAMTTPSRAYDVEKEELFYGEGRILVMDDEEMVRKTCGEMLKFLGYQVAYAREGAEAVRLYQEAVEKGAGESYDAVIMDLTIPGGMGGQEAINILQRLDPDVTAIVSTGYCDMPVVSSYKEYGFASYVSKPYQIKDLSLALKDALEKNLDLRQDKKG